MLKDQKQLKTKFYQLKYKLWAKFFAKHLCEWVLLLQSSKKEQNHSKQNSSTGVSNFTHWVVETNKCHIIK